MITLAAAALAGPAPDGLELPAGADLTVGPDGWTVVVNGRRAVVPPPRGPADLEALRALVASLEAEIALPPANGSVRRALALVPAEPSSTAAADPVPPAHRIAESDPVPPADRARSDPVPKVDPAGATDPVRKADLSSPTRADPPAAAHPGSPPAVDPVSLSGADPVPKVERDPVPNADPSSLSRPDSAPNADPSSLSRPDSVPSADPGSLSRLDAVPRVDPGSPSRLDSVPRVDPGSLSRLDSIPNADPSARPDAVPRVDPGSLSGLDSVPNAGLAPAKSDLVPNADPSSLSRPDSVSNADPSSLSRLDAVQADRARRRDSVQRAAPSSLSRHDSVPNADPSAGPDPAPNAHPGSLSGTDPAPRVDRARRRDPVPKAGLDPAQPAALATSDLVAEADPARTPRRSARRSSAGPQGAPSPSAPYRRADAHPHAPGGGEIPVAALDPAAAAHRADQEDGAERVRGRHPDRRSPTDPPSDDTDATLAAVDADLEGRVPPIRPLDPAPRWSVSIGPELVVRPKLRPGVGAAVALTRESDRLSPTARLSARSPRETGFTSAATVFEALGEVGVEVPTGPVDLTWTAGGTFRVWDDDWGSPTRNLVPRTTLGIGRDLRLGPVTVELDVAVEVDLARTEVVLVYPEGFGAPGLHEEPQVLSPVGLRAELRLR